jgi:hypothetical protein
MYNHLLKKDKKISKRLKNEFRKPFKKSLSKKIVNEMSINKNEKLNF